MTDAPRENGAPAPVPAAQIAEDIIRRHDEFCYGAVQVDTPYCSCAPNGTPLCPACQKLANAITDALLAAALPHAPSPQAQVDVVAAHQGLDRIGAPKTAAVFDYNTGGYRTVPLSIGQRFASILHAPTPPTGWQDMVEAIAEDIRTDLRVNGYPELPTGWMEDILRQHLKSVVG